MPRLKTGSILVSFHKCLCVIICGSDGSAALSIDDSHVICLMLVAAFTTSPFGLIILYFI